VTDATYQFTLPDGLIAQEPAARRGDARLLLVAPGRGPVGERVFRDLPGVLRSGDLLVLNESRVLPARLFTRRVDTGGQVEILLVQPATAPRTWLAMARPARRLRAGVELRIETPDGGEGPRLAVAGRAGDGMVTVTADADPALLAERHGVMPLPPYIRRGRADPRTAADRERYQTVYAADDPAAERSVAAPTAGLHFSAPTLVRLAAAGIGTARVRLHVGPGTFQPPGPDQIAARRLHPEAFTLPRATAAAVAAARAAGGRVIAVGTTSLRVLETAARLDLPAAGGPDRREWPAEADGGAAPVFAGRAERRGGHWEVQGTTRLFLAPPDTVTGADGLLTNFHLPGSSLLMLVAAVLGDPAWRRTYDHAVAQGLRFYSYGDCMLVLPGLEGVPR